MKWGRGLLLSVLGALIMAPSTAQTRDGPSYAVRTGIHKSLVQVIGKNCIDGSRAGSGFTFQSPGTIVTAHHVVGGCSSIKVTYEGVTGSTRTFDATLVRVYAAGDLALLTVTNPPSVPTLSLGALPPDQGGTYAGFGYQNGQPAPGDLLVSFSTGPAALREILPFQARQELSGLGSKIDFNAQVLRFNVALQPGMSGGPIIDSAGQVIGIVAGGLKAGAAPASWGWPAAWLQTLLNSADALNTPVRIGGAYYSLNDLQIENVALQSGRQMQCGQLALQYRGVRTFAQLAPTSDDYPRLQYLMSLSGQSRAQLDSLKFEIWTETASGATAVLPAGYHVNNVGAVCVVSSASGPFRQVIWGSVALTPTDVQIVSTQFETGVMAPLVPYNFGFTVDNTLTTPGAQLRPNGMVFNRKGFVQPKAYWQPGWPPPPTAHTFETLIAKSGTFLGVGTVNDNLLPTLGYCNANQFLPPMCGPVRAHLDEWTHFILATQLSTYPAT